MDKLQNIWLTHTGAVSITSNCINFEMIDAGAKSLLCVARHSKVYYTFDQRLSECKSKKNAVSFNAD